VAVVAVKLLGVPGPAEGHQERAPVDDDSIRITCSDFYVFYYSLKVKLRYL